jgi:uncharacterized SAM-binding protein YcdF (DUF218 family)
MDSLKRPVEILCSPVGIAVILTGLGIMLGCLSRHRQTGRRLLISGGLLFLVFLLTPAAKYLVWGLEKDYPPLLNPPALPGMDRIVILAGYGEDHRGFPVTSRLSETTVCSLSEGLRLYRLLPGAKLIVSGGVVRDGEKPVAAAMSEFLQQMGVPAGDILIEGLSRNTYENLVEVKKLVASKPFILVAQACDLRRAAAVARKLQMRPIAAPACHWALQHFSRRRAVFVHPSTDNLSRIQWAYHEYAGYLWYRLLGQI